MRVAVALLAVSLYSRLYLGVHWPTDIVGGVLVGLVWLAGTHAAYRGPVVAKKVPGAGEVPAPGG
jgi:membrane-associated phospholipid phosphatase